MDAGKPPVRTFDSIDGSVLDDGLIVLARHMDFAVVTAKNTARPHFRQPRCDVGPNGRKTVITIDEYKIERAIIESLYCIEALGSDGLYGRMTLDVFEEGLVNIEFRNDGLMPGNVRIAHPCIHAEQRPTVEILDEGLRAAISQPTTNFKHLPAWSQIYQASKGLMIERRESDEFAGEKWLVH